MKTCKYCDKVKSLWRFPYFNGKIQDVCKTCEVKVRKEEKQNEKLTPDERVELFLVK